MCLVLSSNRMSSPNKTKNTCFACGEDMLVTGNFHVKVLRSKRVPKKVQQLILKKTATGVEDEEYVKCKKGRFKKYLKNDAKSLSSNVMEITCGVCKSVSKINMRKSDNYTELNLSKRGTPSSVSQSASTPSTPLTKSQKKKQKQRRSKTPKDLNAGLIIPESMRRSSGEPKSKRPRLQVDETPTNKKLPIAGGMEQNVNPSQKASKPTQKSLQAMADAQKQKQVNNLRKTLFKSQRRFDSTTSSKSLQDFLS